ncbi:hypothetical protein C8R43DRAFT_1139634 [Mycena crocata]|nr:hypothetical protein C8R43DRAFT_1140242 [Mycena crocata]KAJ7109683.1 hypothetical protein C8R43DRAFT_1139634 [Mycena crocata]
MSIAASGILIDEFMTGPGVGLFWDSYLLATASYPQDFRAARERSRKLRVVPLEGPPLRNLFSFKTTKTPPWGEDPLVPEARRRLHRAVPAYVARLFGRVHAVMHVEDDEVSRDISVVRLKCPPDADARAAALFRSQRDVLEHVVETDRGLLGGSVRRGFCEDDGIDVWMRPDGFVAGQDLICRVELVRLQSDRDDEGLVVKEYRVLSFSGARPVVFQPLVVA